MAPEPLSPHSRFTRGGAFGPRSFFARRRTRRHKAARFAPFAFGPEMFEDRRLLAAFHWATTISGNFNDPTNWLDQGGNHGVPGPNDDANIGPSNITVTVPASASLNTLNSNASIAVTGGTL